MARTHLLITGFGPFPGMSNNPSARLAQELARLPVWQRIGWRAEARILPVSYGMTEAALMEAMKRKPSAILMFGVAGRANAIRIETTARNRRSRTIKDATGQVPGGMLLDDGPATLRARAPFLPICQAFRHASLPVRLSRDAGPYLCNAGYRVALRHSSTATTVMFIHIPRLKRLGDARGLPLKPVLKASLKSAIRLVKAARFS